MEAVFFYEFCFTALQVYFTHFGARSPYEKLPGHLAYLGFLSSTISLNGVWTHANPGGENQADQMIRILLVWTIAITYRIGGNIELSRESSNADR